MVLSRRGPQSRLAEGKGGRGNQSGNGSGALEGGAAQVRSKLFELDQKWRPRMQKITHLGVIFVPSCANLLLFGRGVSILVAYDRPGGLRSMFKKARQREILKMVAEKGKAEVATLARHLHVSVMTIRRDLLEMDRSGLLERVHGGALLQGNGSLAMEPPVLERTKEAAEVKERLGQYVAQQIRDGEKIFLGSGSTTEAVAEALAHHSNLTVLTNALNIANALVSAPGISVTMTGGFLRRSELSLIGHFAENMLQGLQVDKVIIGMRGIDPVKGLTSDNMDELMTDQAILNVSKTVLVVADHSKFGHVAAIRTAPVTAASMIVTDSGGPKDILDVIRKMGVRIIEVDHSMARGANRGHA